MAPGTDGLKQEIPVEDQGVKRLSVFRDRPTGVSERLKTDVEGS